MNVKNQVRPNERSFVFANLPADEQGRTRRSNQPLTIAKAMRIKFFYEDLNESALGRLRLIVRDKIQSQITDAVEQHGIDPEQAETELVDEHLNRHNFGFVVEA